MFRTAELGRKVSKEEFEAVAPGLRIEILELQQRLRAADFPVIIVLAASTAPARTRPSTS